MEDLTRLVDAIRKKIGYLSESQVLELMPYYLIDGIDTRIESKFNELVDIIAHDMEIKIPLPSSRQANGFLIEDDEAFYGKNIVRDFGYLLRDFRNSYFSDYYDSEFTGTSKRNPLPLYFSTYFNDGGSITGFGGVASFSFERKITPVVGLANVKTIQKKNIVYKIQKPAQSCLGQGVSIDFSVPKSHRNRVVSKAVFVGSGETNKIEARLTFEDKIQPGYKVTASFLDETTFVESVSGNTITLNKKYNFIEIPETEVIFSTTDRKQEVSFSLKFKADSGLSVKTKNTFKILFYDVLSDTLIDSGTEIINTTPNQEIVVAGKFAPDQSQIHRLLIHVQDDDPTPFTMEISSVSAKARDFVVYGGSETGIIEDVSGVQAGLENLDKPQSVNVGSIFPVLGTVEERAGAIIKEEFDKFQAEAGKKPEKGIGTWRPTNFAKVVGTNSLTQTLTTLNSIKGKLKTISSALETAKEIAEILSQLEELALDPFNALAKGLISEFEELMASAKSSGIYLLDLQELTGGFVGNPLGIRYVIDDKLDERLSRSRKNVLEFNLAEQEGDTLGLTPTERAKLTKESSDKKRVEGNDFFFGKERYSLVPYFSAPMLYDDFIQKIADAFIDPNDKPDGSIIDGTMTWRSSAEFTALPEVDFLQSARGKIPIPGSSTLKPRPFTFRSGAPQWGRGTTATAHLLVFALPNFTLFLRMKRRWDRVMKQSSGFNNIGDSYISWYNDVVNSFALPDFSPGKLIRAVENFNFIHAPSNGGGLPDFYGVNVYTMFPQFFDYVDRFVRAIKDKINFSSDSLAEVIRETIDAIQKGINIIIDAIEIISDLIEFLESLLLTQFAILTVTSNDGVYDLREKILNAEGFPAVLGSEMSLEDQLIGQSANQSKFRDIRDVPMWYGGIVISYGLVTDLKPFESAINKRFENAGQQWDDAKSEIQENITSAKNSSGARNDALFRRLLG